MCRVSTVKNLGNHCAIPVNNRTPPADDKNFMSLGGGGGGGGAGRGRVQCGV